MHIQVFYDNGNYETFSTPSMPFEEGRYTVEDTFLQFTDLLKAPSQEEMALRLERCYWTVEDEENKKKDSGGFRVDVPARLLNSSELQAVLAIVVDGMCMLARCDGILRSYLDPEFENPMLVGFDIEKMTGGAIWDKTMSIARPENMKIMAARETSAQAEDNTGKATEATNNSELNGAEEKLQALEELYPGVNEDEDEVI